MEQNRVSKKKNSTAHQTGIRLPNIRRNPFNMFKEPDPKKLIMFANFTVRVSLIPHWQICASEKNPIYLAKGRLQFIP